MFAISCVVPAFGIMLTPRVATLIPNSSMFVIFVVSGVGMYADPVE